MRSAIIGAQVQKIILPSVLPKTANHRLTGGSLLINEFSSNPNRQTSLKTALGLELSRRSESCFLRCVHTSPATQCSGLMGVNIPDRKLMKTSVVSSTRYAIIPALL